MTATKHHYFSTAWTALMSGAVAYLMGYFSRDVRTALPLPWQHLSEVVQGYTAGDTRFHNGSSCSVHNLFADEDVPGMHLACVTRKRNVLHATVFRDGRNVSTMQVESRADWFVFQQELQAALRTDEGPTKDVDRGNDGVPNTKQPWAIFTPQGDHITSIENVAEGRNAFIIYEGGAFIWPGVRVGHVTVVDRVDGMGSLKLRTESLKPLVFTIEGFLRDVECEHIRGRGDPHLQQSGVALMDHDKGKQATDWRTSSTHFLPSRGDAMLEAVDRRTRDLTRLPVSHQEQVQLLRYEVGQRYDAHHDYFDRRLYSDQSTLDLIDGGKRNRLATLLWYVSDVEEGGETIFPRANGAPEPRDKRNCDLMGGLRIRPKKGRVILFYSLLPNGDLDVHSLHASCAVKSGTKYAANKWCWNSPISHILG